MEPVKHAQSKAKSSAVNAIHHHNTNCLIHGTAFCGLSCWHLHKKEQGLCQIWHVTDICQALELSSVSFFNW
jgi:hypothetical protein